METPTKIPRILIFEDESIIAHHLADTLTELGYEVAAVLHKADEAIAVLRQTKPDLVLMDIRLGGELDGITLAEEIYTCETTPVVFVSAYADTETLDRAKLSGAFGFITKPITSKQLRATILIALEKHDELQKASPSRAH